MKTWPLTALLFLSLETLAKPSVLLTYYDPFGKAEFNNSETIALEIQKRFKNKAHPVEIKLCRLNTVFDKAFIQTEECLKEMENSPDLVLGLGEALCEMKVETMVRNRDHTFGPDNERNERKNETIIYGGAEKIGLNYPIEKMYCSLDKKMRKSFNVSTNAGSFVCNNTAYQMRYHYPNTSYGFIHVPANNCKDIKRKTKVATDAIEQLILNSKAYLNPHLTELPTSHDEILSRRESAQTKCEKEFFKRMKI